jgi:MFS family permease
MKIKNHESVTELRRSLNLIILGVTFGIAFFTIVGNPAGNAAPFTGFSRALGASDVVYGIILAMPVVGGVIQLFASYFLEITGKRKQLFLVFGIIHRILWIPVAAIPFIIPQNHNIIRIWSIVVLITTSSAANSIAGIAFFSWMGALIPMEIRGRFFSRRTMIYTISAALTAMLVGKFLDLNHTFNGYATVFVIAAILGLIDIIVFIWVKHPPMEIPDKRPPFFEMFTKAYKNKNYVKYIMFVCVWNFGVNFSGPFFNVYMLEHLKMSFFTMSIFGQVVSNVATIFSIRYWGKLVDKYGNKPILAICSTIIIFFPLLWLFAAPQNYYIILLINTMAGICWPGFEMTSTNMSIWLAPKDNRSIYIANYTLLTSTVGVALAYISGGIFMQYARPYVAGLNIPFLMGQNLNAFHILFAISSIVRTCALLFFLPKIREENSIPPGKLVKDLMSNVKAKLNKDVGV